MHPYVSYIYDITILISNATRRVVILNSVLVGLLVYYFSFYKAPKKVINILNKIQRKFLWGGNSEKKKISWIKWDTVCKPKEEGGLNVRNLEFFNLALLTKWKWRLINDEDGLWKKIIAAKYGKIERPGDFSCSRRTRSHSTWWADLLKIKTLDNGQNWFVDGISRRLGNGTRTKFWTDIWIGDEPLSLRFCRLYRIALDKDATIFEKGEWRGNDQGWTWQWRWRRALFTWEENLLQDLIQVISTISPKPDRADSWTWKWDEKGAYTVRSAYSILTGKNNNISTTMFKKLWESEVPTKMRMFAWRAMLDRIPTRLNLLRRGVNFNGNSTNCALCECFEENSDHLFCKCTFTYQIWSSVLFWFGLECAFVGNVKDHYIQFMELFPRAKGRNEWKSIWFFVIWVIWSFRNSLIFSQGQGTIQDLIHVVKAKSWCWIKARHKNFPYSMFDWSTSPMYCL